MLASAVLALLLFAAPPGRALADGAEDAIRSTLQQWTKDFNSGNADAACKLFSPQLRYDFRGYPERGYEDICALLTRSLRDESKRYAYSLDIREIIVSGDLAVVRLAWTLNVTLPNGQVVTTVEPGMDVFRRGADGQWQIIRYTAYELPERPSRKDE
ncbi:MAG: nuclear transport factor 2 family protein [Hyphomicrobium sp.]